MQKGGDMSDNERTPVWENEDWWACFIGLIILVLAIFNFLPKPPKIGTWTNLFAAFPKGFGPTLWTSILLFATIGVLTLIGGYFMKFDINRYLPGFALIFIISFVSMVIAKQAFIKKWGFPTCFLRWDSA